MSVKSVSRFRSDFFKKKLGSDLHHKFLKDVFTLMMYLMQVKF